MVTRYKILYFGRLTAATTPYILMRFDGWTAVVVVVVVVVNVLSCLFGFIEIRYQQHMDVSLVDWIGECYGELPNPVIKPASKYVQLQVAAVDDDDNPWKVPAVVYRFRK